MSKPTDLGKIPVCAKQAWSFDLKLVGVAADASSMTGMVLNGQIRKSAAPSTALVTPTIVVSAPVVTTATATVTATVSVTEAQMASLSCTEKNFTTPTSYVLDIEGAYSDAPTIETLRFVASIDIYQGGLAGV